jgi:hypothetical protein
MRGVALVLALALLRCLAGAQAVTAHASVDSTQYLVGDWIQVHVNVAHPRGTTLYPSTIDSVNGFTVLGRLPIKLVSDTTTTTGVVVARYDSGTAVLPPLSFQYSLPGDTSRQAVSTNPLLLTVRTVQVDTTKDIRDLKPPLSIPVSLLEALLYVGALIVIGGLIYLGYLIWKKFRTKPAGQQYVPPPKAAHLIAFEELAALREKKLWQKGHIKEFYSEVTEILRRYVENRYQIKALEETTDEILLALAGINIKGDILRAIEKILRRADLVKFAKAQPGIPEHEEMVTVTQDAVERTKVIPEPEGEPSKGTSHGS